MDRIEKVKNYLKISGYSKDRIEKIINNPKHCSAIYSHIVAYEMLNKEDSVQIYGNLNSGRTKK